MSAESVSSSQFPFQPSPILQPGIPEQAESGVLVGLAVLFLMSIFDLGFAAYGRRRLASKLVNVWLGALFVSTSLGMIVRVFPRSFNCGQVQYSASAGMFGLSCMLLLVAIRLHRMIQELRITIPLFVCFALQVGSIIWQAAVLSTTDNPDGSCTSSVDQTASLFQAAVFFVCSLLLFSCTVYARVAVVKMEGQVIDTHCRELSVLLLPFSFVQFCLITGWFFSASPTAGGFTASYILLSTAYANANITLFFVDKFQTIDHEFIDNNGDDEIDAKTFGGRKSVVQSMRSFFQPTEATSVPYRDQEYLDTRTFDERDSFIHDDMSYDDESRYRDSRYTDVIDPRETFQYSEYTKYRGY
ncbi:MAG: hypothetical protein SGCHY_004896 [Lobulomycetales sp.]